MQKEDLVRKMHEALLSLRDKILSNPDSDELTKRLDAYVRSVSSIMYEHVDTILKEEISRPIDELASNITKREYYAAMVLQGILSSDTNVNWSKGDAVEWSVEYADLLSEKLKE